MNSFVAGFIVDFVLRYPSEKRTRTRWLKPLVAFADSNDPLFGVLKDAVGPDHLLPSDILSGARSVIAYFLPFDRSVAESNASGREASPDWALAYVETNALISELNSALAAELERLGYRAAVIPPTHNFDREKLMSSWSHRHAAYIAGLGKFGLNNMLITARGCCGRLGTLVTDAPLEPTPREEGECCLYKLNGSCKSCIKRCVNGALAEGRYDRRKCYEMCRENAKRFDDLGSPEVCGKCMVGIPCSFERPTVGDAF
ncbi:MAG: epoxyqueuosine reductase [Thermacetogeniaceae bacterium]